MATTDRLTQSVATEPLVSPVTLVRIAIILAVLAIWEFLAHSGLLYRDVVPSLFAIGRALYDLLSHDAGEMRDLLRMLKDVLTVARTPLHGGCTHGRCDVHAQPDDRRPLGDNH